ncbi:hypothetical protein BT63DRAFT_428078 [Microthyrium microscopicum]|uniref:Cyanovirin-N domain-containing protein n=1 Tax=Microthyrium microscopicum TaxID=703497 RepID=A0A6A6U1Z3_9PEZI|nr:hypothetical protein BT63DRAFT_428078 [Microthyrium microscopicum]
MLLNSILLIGASITFVHGRVIQRDVPCSPENMPVNVGLTTCTKKFPLDSAGHCISAIPSLAIDPSACTGYCEQKLTLNYGQEVPFANSHCSGVGNGAGNTTCTLQQSQSVTVTNTVGISAGGTIGGSIDDLEAAFNLGATWSWSKAVGYETTASQAASISSGMCGYWTFIPYLMVSCGTLTNIPAQSLGKGTYLCDTKSVTSLKNTINWCNTTPQKDANGHAGGKVVFVFTDCKTNNLLPMAVQDPAYAFPGVSTGQLAQVDNPDTKQSGP